MLPILTSALQDGHCMTLPSQKPCQDVLMILVYLIEQLVDNHIYLCKYSSMEYHPMNRFGVSHFL